MMARELESGSREGIHRIYTERVEDVSGQPFGFILSFLLRPCWVNSGSDSEQAVP